MSKVVVITGGNSGIREACAWKFASEQYTVIVWDVILCGESVKPMRLLSLCTGLARRRLLM